MRVALIAPYSLMPSIPQTGYHLVLAHLLGNKTYRDFVREAPGHKILDNGAAEEVVTGPEELVQLASDIDATEIVVPDVQREALQTVKLASEFKTAALEHPEFRYVGVLQGETTLQRQHVMDQMMALEYIDVFAVPRNAVRDGMERADLMVDAYSLFPDLKFHALGSSEWCEEVKVLSNLPNVRGADTAMPIKMGINRQYLTPSSCYLYLPHDEGYFEWDRTGSVWSIIVDNIRTYLNWAKCEASPPSGL